MYSMENNVINISKMEFKIDKNSNLTVTSDKKTTTLITDRSDLISLMEFIQKHIEETADIEVEKTVKGVVYRYNPRSRRLERVEE